MEERSRKGKKTTKKSNLTRSGERRRSIQRDKPRWSDDAVSTPAGGPRQHSSLVMPAILALILMAFFAGLVVLSIKFPRGGWKIDDALAQIPREQWRRSGIVLPADSTVRLGSGGPLAREALSGDKLLGRLFDRIAGIIVSDGKRKTYAENLASAILFESAAANFDPLFVTAVIRTESGFNRLAVSRVGATGLMQIMPRTRLHVESVADIRENRSVALTDTRHNIKVGIAYLKQLEANYRGNSALTLMAYNWGPSRLDDAIAGNRKVPREVLQYARKILGDLKKWSDAVRS